MKLADLKLDRQNRRKHTPRNLAMLTEALRTVGAARSIVIDESGEILAGNGVVTAATEMGLQDVQVVDAVGDALVAVRRSGLTAEQKRALAIYDNRTAELAEWDWAQLAEDHANGLTLEPWWTTEELQLPKRAGLTDPDAVPEVRATDIQRGDLFELGPHRLLCGDSTVAADVARVMGEERAVASVTDPPYSVDYENQAREPGRATRRQRGDTYTDPVDVGQLLTFIAHLPADLLVMTYAFNKHFQELSAATRTWDLLYECIWLKQHFAFVIGRRFQPQHEPILIFRRQGGRSTFNVPPSQSTVFKHDKASANEDHPTSKPIALWNDLIAFHSDPKDIVYEPFSGGGTSFIACEQLERQCIGLEIQPQYVQVTLDRWEAFTGQRAVKVGDANS